MSLKLNIGLSRKVGEANYGSRGASINMEVEVDSSLVNEPDKLKDRIHQLFGQVRSSLANELERNGNARPATQSQLRAISAICRNQGLDVDQIVQDRCHVQQPQDLSLIQASHLIDELKRPVA